MTETRTPLRTRLRRMGLLTPTGIYAVSAALAMLLLVIFGPVIWGGPATRIDVDHALQGPSLHHPFGTDGNGRDILARMLVAGRLSIGLAVITALAAAMLGIPLGAVVGVLTPRFRRLVGEGINLLLAFPAILVALFVTAVLGAGVKSVAFALAIAAAPGFARLAQTLSASLAKADYVAAARIAGFSRRRILARHVLPNIAEPLVLTIAVSIGGVLLAFAALSFLGLGIQPPSYDWGRILNEGLDRLYDSPLCAIGPGVIIVLAGMSFNVIGDTLARIFAGSRTTASGLKVRAPRLPHTGTLRRSAAEPALVVEKQEDPDVLRVVDLTVDFDGVRVVDGVSLSVSPGERVAIVGESGSGKTLVALASARLAPPAARVSATVHAFRGRPIGGKVDAAQLGTGVAFIFQDPLSTWNPALKVGTQMIEATVEHRGTPKDRALGHAIELLRSVRVTSPERRLSQYPHELSGGMRQRAMLATGLMTDPILIIADEPTTALDVTVQKQVLHVLREATDASGASLLLISHDLGVVTQLCDRVVVMYAGRIVEDAPIEHLLTHPQHPYTAGLLGTMPTLETDLDQPLASIPGHQPEPSDRPSGCAFRTRCSRASDLCAELAPTLEPLLGGHRSACWHPVAESRECAATDSWSVRQ